jgi:hypothetical protein
MKLCFGTYAGVLTHFLKKGQSHKALLHTIVRSVDPACKLSDNAVTNLLRCESNLPDSRANGLGDVISKAQSADPQTVAAYFSAKLPDKLVGENRQLIFLALKDLICNDDSIGGTAVIDKVSGLTKDTLRKHSRVAFADFLAGVFLYVAGVDNKCGKTKAERITREYIDGFADEMDAISFIVNRRQGDKISADEAFIDYNISAKAKYGKIKTLLYKNEPAPFYDFYVPNNVEQWAGRNLRAAYKDVTAESLTSVSNFIILGGIGGLGKSMMLRHLLLDAIANYDSFHHIPVFISLKDFADAPLADFIYAKVATLCDLVDRSAFDSALHNGLCLLLFDGLDEMNGVRSKRFERELEEFTDRYPKNHYVISSRPYQSFAAFSRFTSLGIQPFTKEQSVRLVERLGFRDDEPDIKKKFLSNLESGKYNTHKSFVENPLLLTIMLLTFERYADIPTRIHNFYREAYITLYLTHDANKGGFSRLYNSRLDVDEFADFFAEFCFRTYRDSKFEFSENEFGDYFDKLTVNERGVKPGDFAKDLYANLCLMLLDGGKLYFTHRSFQEYFCAVFFSKQSESILRKLGDFFESRQKRMRGDSTFDMLYDIARPKVEANILIPYLQTLFDECDAKAGYRTFLEKMYPVITFEKGEVNAYTSIEPTSYLFAFIAALLGVDWSKHCEDLPGDDRLVIDEYGTLLTGEETFELVRIDDEDTLFREYDWLEEIPEAEGWRYGFEVAAVYGDSRFDDIAAVLKDDGFIFKMEYDAARRYLAELVEKHRRKDDSLAGLL